MANQRRFFRLLKRLQESESAIDCFEFNSENSFKVRSAFRELVSDENVINQIYDEIANQNGSNSDSALGDVEEDLYFEVFDKIRRQKAQLER